MLKENDQQKEKMIKQLIFQIDVTFMCHIEFFQWSFLKQILTLNDLRGIIRY